MVHHKLTFTLSLISALSLCQASSFVYEDFLAYPRYRLELTEKKIPESAVFGQQQQGQLKNKQQIGWRNTEDYQHRVGSENQVVMMSANAQPFLCTIPDVTAQEKQRNSKTSSSSLQESQRVIERGLELLKPLEKECLYYYTHGYWTYEYCHMRHVRQFHFDASKPDDNDKYISDEKSSYLLGLSPYQEQGKLDDAPSSKSSHKPQSPPTEDYHHLDVLYSDNKEPDTLATSTTPIGAGAAESSASTSPSSPSSSSSSSSTILRRVGDKQVLVQRWGNGTPCDITNQPRAIEVQYQCALNAKDHIAFFEEVSTCHYLMTISTPRLCDDLALGSRKDSESYSIECNPIVPEHWITDHDTKQEESEDALSDTTAKATATDKATYAETAAIPSSSSGLSQKSNGENDPQEKQGEARETLEQLETAELVDMVSNLAKQVEQLQRSMEHQFSMDQLLQDSQVYVLDENGGLLLESGGIDLLQQQQQQQQQQHQPQSQQQWQSTPMIIKEAAQAIVKQFLIGSSSPSPKSSVKDTKKKSTEESETQKKNKKAYEKNYYVA